MMTKKTQNKPLTVLRTDGSGYWSKRVGNVNILRFEITQSFYNELDGDSHQYGEMRVFFETSLRRVNGWQVPNYGFIYTDKLWLTMLRQYLQSKGFSEAAIQDVSYSEQGMQGRDYVSLDVGDSFLKELDPLLNFVQKKEITLPFKLEKDYQSW
jgi:hypothetical protein